MMEFGGSPGPWTGSSEKQPKMADTTILHFSECILIFYLKLGGCNKVASLWLFCVITLSC